ncbi:MAG TPA: glutaminyl-peptide cyclotransferase [Caulobacteraceae bacterium]
MILRWPPRTADLLVAAVALLAWVLGPAAAAAIPVDHVEVVRAYPHDPDAFTEGLFWQGGALYESSGRYQRSNIRKVDLATGKVLQRRDLDPAYFGEGFVAWKGRLIQLTWKVGTGFIYDLASFKPLGEFHYAGDGWALTEDGHQLIMSDGTPVLRFLDPGTLKPVRTLKVTADGQPVDNINELEWVKGEILANIWMTSRIARIDPASGHVVGWIDLGALGPAGGDDPDAVANGIAYDAATDRLFVTGKLWPKLYEVRIVHGRRHG